MPVATLEGTGAAMVAAIDAFQNNKPLPGGLTSSGAAVQQQPSSAAGASSSGSSSTAQRAARGAGAAPGVPPPYILLVSFERAPAGTNLTEASHVVFVHPYCGPADEARATELQAVGRARRIGQKRDKVVVWHFVAKRTIEEAISVEHEQRIKAQREEDAQRRDIAARRAEELQQGNHVVAGGGQRRREVEVSSAEAAGARGGLEHGHGRDNSSVNRMNHESGGAAPGTSNDQKLVPATVGREGVLFLGGHATRSNSVVKRGNEDDGADKRPAKQQKASGSWTNKTMDADVAGQNGNGQGQGQGQRLGAALYNTQGREDGSAKGAASSSSKRWYE